MSFQSFVVESSTGPHLTMQAGIVHAGRYWTTTSRSSAKAKVLRKRDQAAWMESREDGWTLAGGSTVVLDATRPLDAMGDVFGAMNAGLAVSRLALEQLAQVAGYVERATSVPGSWLPAGRVVLVTKRDRSIELDETGAPARATGEWDGPGASMAVDRGAPTTGQQVPAVDMPDSARALLDRPTDTAWLGVMTAAGPAAIPARWDPERGATVPRSATELLAARIPGPVCLTVDESDDHRPDAKVGVMLRGGGALTDLDGDDAVVAIAAEKVTYWNGFDAGSVRCHDDN